jgi:hypothetical protein
MRTINDILGGPPPGEMGGSAAGVATAALNSSVGQTGQVNSVPLGSATGAPPWARSQQIAVLPFTAINNRQQATLVAERARQNRVITFIAPAVAFNIFIGDSGVKPGVGLALPPGSAFDIIIPGGQEVYAVTDAPVYLPVQIFAAPLLTGDKERKMG